MLHSSTTHRLIRLLKILGVISIFLIFLNANTAVAVIKKTNEPITLNFGTLNVQPGSCTGVTGYPGWIGAKPENGVYTFPAGSIPVGTYSFEFRCSSLLSSAYAGGPVYSVQPLTVVPYGDVKVGITAYQAPNPFVNNVPFTFTTTKSNLSGGTTATLNWNYGDPYGTCTGFTTNVQGSLVVTNKAQVCESEAFTYSLTCSSPGVAARTISHTITMSKPLKPGQQCP